MSSTIGRCPRNIDFVYASQGAILAGYGFDILVAAGLA